MLWVISWVGSVARENCEIRVSFWTVRAHIGARLRKIGVRNRTEAMAAHR